MIWLLETEARALSISAVHNRLVASNAAYLSYVRPRR